jgi:hypothetical protein
MKFGVDGFILGDDWDRSFRVPKEFVYSAIWAVRPKEAYEGHISLVSRSEFVLWREYEVGAEAGSGLSEGQRLIRRQQMRIWHGRNEFAGGVEFVSLLGPKQMRKPIIGLEDAVYRGTKPVLASVGEACKGRFRVALFGCNQAEARAFDASWGKDHHWESAYFDKVSGTVSGIVSIAELFS